MRILASTVLAGSLAVWASGFGLNDLAEAALNTKIKDNAKKHIQDCKSFYDKHKIVYKGYNDVDIDSHTDAVALKKEKVLNQLREYNLKKKEKLSPFNYKWVQVDTDTEHFACKVVLGEGLSKKEQKAFAEETYKKFDPK